MADQKLSRCHSINSIQSFNSSKSIKEKQKEVQFMIIALNRTARISNPVRRIQSITSHLATRTMTSTSTNHSHKDGSTNWASNDGQFKRQVSSFRDEIKKGGKFEPEVGQLAFKRIDSLISTSHSPADLLTLSPFFLLSLRSLSSDCSLCLSMGSQSFDRKTVERFG